MLLVSTAMLVSLAAVVATPTPAVAATPVLTVTLTSSSASSPAAGAPVTYGVTPRLTSSSVTHAISVTLTVPTGLVARGGYGSGWVCAAPSGRIATCTTSATRFGANTTLPALTMLGVVTGASVTGTFIRANTSVTASSSGATSGTDATATAVTPASAPTDLSVNPGVGPVGGGNTVIGSGTTQSLPTAIEIGTLAEQQAGTSVVLFPCASGRANGCFDIEGSSLAIASMPARASAATVRMTVVTLGVDAYTTYVYAGSPAAPAAPTATAGITSVAVSWVAPDSAGSAVTGYIVTPYLSGTAQTAQYYAADVTSHTFTGLTPGTSWTYTVAAYNSIGTSAASSKSGTAVPYTLPGAPTITAVSAGDSSATLTWTAPSNGSNAITAYVITPYAGSTAQAAQTVGAGTTQTATGLTAGTSYTFTVAAINDAGTGPASARSAAVVPNTSPSLTFAAPPPGEVGVAYSRQLTYAGGTSPVTWSVSVGTLPAGLSLTASTGLLSGTPSAGSTVTFTVKIVDASNQSATRSVTLVIAAAPGITFAPAAGEVGVAYSEQPTVSGGTGPYTWAVTAGSLPAGLSLSSSTGVVSGTPTAAGTFRPTVTVTDSLSQVASSTPTVVVVARPAFATGAPVSGQVGVAYGTSFDVTGGTLPLTWSIAAGNVPPGLTLNTATGALSGTPTTTGSSAFTVSVVDAKNQTATKAVTLVVGAGPLVITKSASISSAEPGATVTYTVTVRNTGSTAWTGASFSDPLTGVLDDATYDADATTTGGTLSYTAPTLGWSGNIAAAGTVTITYSVTVRNPDSGNKVLANTVTSTTLGTNCASGSTDALCSATVNVEGLSIVKTTDASTTTPGSTVHAKIVATNTGAVPISGATLTDNLTGVLDDAAYNSDATATSGGITYSSPSLTWTGTLAAGASATITYSVTVSDPDVGNRTLSGTIVSSSPGSTCPSGNPAASCTVTVTVLVPKLVITTTSTVSTTTPGTTVPFTMTVSNTGQTAYAGASVTLALAGALDDAVYNNNATSSSGTVGYSGGTLTWTGAVAIGQQVTVSGSVTVSNPDPGNRTLTAQATSGATGSTCLAASRAAACTAVVQVLVPALLVTKAADVTSSTPGSVVTYTVSVTNTGQTAYAGATFSDPLSGVLDDATYNGDAAASSGAVSYSSPTIVWTGDLAIGASATITYSVTVLKPDTGDRTLANTVASTTAGSNCAASSVDARCTSSIAVLVPGLSIVGSVNRSTAAPGDVVSYTLTVRNTGQTTYTNAVVYLDLSGVADDATYNHDAHASTGTETTNIGSVNTWTLSLAPGESATSTASVTVSDPDTGDGTLRTVTSSSVPGSTCPVDSTTPACHTSVGVLEPGLVLTKTADRSTATPGGTVDYTVSVVNSGETTYPAATFSDDLSQVLGDATYAGGATATVGTVSFSSPTLSWTGALAPGETATISYTVTVRDPDPGDKNLTNTVVSTSRATNCAAGSTDSRCTASVVVLVPALTITTAANSATTAPRAVVAYTLTVINSGATPATGAALSDALADVVDDATYNADVSASSGTAAVAGSTLTWSGDLAVGASSTITYSVTVHAADGGNNRLTDLVTSSTRGNNCSAASADAGCSSSVPVARLMLAYGATAVTTTPGSVVQFTATYTNTGQVPYTDISVASQSTDASDDALAGGTQTASSGTFVLNEAGTTWTGSIPVGGVVTVSGTAPIADPDTGDGVFTVTMLSAAAGSSCSAASTTPACSVTVTVQTPALTLTKVASTTSSAPGDVVGYTITVHNTGEATYVGAEASDSLDDLLDEASYNGDASATVGAVSYTSPRLEWTGDLAVGDTATITYSVTVNSPATGDKAMRNEVTSSDVGSTCPPAGTSDACSTTVAILTPGLTIVKTADHVTATLGTDVVYSVEVTNSGQTAYAAAAFSDSLAGVLDDATYIPAATTSSSGAVDYGGGVLTWSGALAPGESATVTYTVTVANPDTGDGTMNNTATSVDTGNNCPSGGTDSRCTASVAIVNSVSLTFTKTADVLATTAGAVVGYTLTATNSSDDPVEASVSDPLGGILDDATYDDDADATSGTAVYTEPDLEWSGTVQAGETVSVTYTVTVHATATGDQILEGTVTSAFPTSSNNCLAGSQGPRCTSTLPVAGLLIQESYTETSTTPGSLAHLTASFTNTGQMPYEGISVTSPGAGVLDDAVATGNQTASSGTLVLTASGITWTGDIPIGATITMQGTVRVQDPDTGDLKLTGTASSTALGNNCPVDGTDRRCTATLAVLLPGLTITKTADTTSVVPGGTVGYTIVIHNTGQTAYAGAVVSDSLAGVVDDATYNTDATVDGGGVVFVGSTLTWTGDLAVGATVTITYTVTAQSPGTGDKTMVNVVSSTEAGSTCPVASASEACRSTVAILTPALTLTSAASAASSAPGQVVTFTVTVANTGQTTYPTAAFSVPLGGILDDATLDGAPTATTGSVSVDAGTLTWTGALDPDASSTVTYAVTVAAPPTGDFTLSQTVTSSVQGSTCPSGSTNPSCTTTVLIASLLIHASYDVATSEPTGVVVNTTTLTNTGTVAYTGLSVSSAFADTLDDATNNADVTATAGSLSLDPANGSVTWTGDLAPGATVTVTGSLTVNNPTTGDGVLSTVVTTDAVGSNCPTAAPGDGCRSQVTLLNPELSITKVSDVSSAAPGQTVSYTITATNTGETTYSGATITDSLGGVATNVVYQDDAAATSGSVAYDATQLTWTGDLAPDQVVEITFTVVVDDPYLGDGVLANSVASDELGSTCPTSGGQAGCTALVAILVPALDLVIAADRSTTIPGATVGYTVTVHNTGQTAYQAAVVTMDLTGGLDDAGYGGGATATIGALSYSAPGLTWTGDLAVGATATINYVLTVSDPDTGNLSLDTTVSSSEPGSTCGTRASCSSAVTVLIPGLAVSVTSDAASTTTPGDVVSFTITVSNTGQTPYDGTITTDLGDVTDDAVVHDTVTATLGVAEYTAPTLTWTGSLSAGATATIHYAVTVQSPDTGDRAMSSTVVADSPGSTCPVTGPDAACSVSVQVLIPGLTITKSAGSATTTPGAVIDYTILIRNTGETAYAAAAVEDSMTGVLTDGDYNGDAVVVGGGVLEYEAPVLAWRGALPIGATASITYSITVDSPDAGDRHLVNKVTSSTPGSNCPADGGAAAECSSAVDVLVPALTITKTADTATVVAGSDVHYTVTVSNTGQTDYAPATITDVLAGVLDDASYTGGATADRGTVDVVAGTLSWSGPLALGETATITYAVTTSLPATGDRSLTNAVTSESPGSDCISGAEAACTTSVAVLVPALEITKTASATSVAAGGVLEYTITATNTGAADFAAAELTDSLAGVLDDASYDADATADSGDLTYGSGTLGWSGALAVGASVNISYSVTTHVAVTGDEVLTNRVVSTSPGSTCAADSVDPRCATTTDLLARTLELSGLTQSFSLGGVPHTVASLDGAVTMTVTTNSPAGYSVSVVAGDSDLTGASGNTDVVPISLLRVRPSGTTDFFGLSSSTPRVVHQQDRPSAPGGDAVSNDFQIEIPDVSPDTYSTTLNYIVTAQ